MHWVASTDANLLEGTEADLIPFFNSSPIIFLILIPAITMRFYCRRKKNRNNGAVIYKTHIGCKNIISKIFR